MIHLNLIDIIIIIILIYNILKGLRFGLIVSILSIIGYLLSLYIVSKYYLNVYSFIMKSPFLYGIFERLAEIILAVVFYRQAKNNTNFVPDLISDGIVEIIVMIISAVVIYILVNALVNILLELFSRIFNVPILKQLNKIGGMIFGLIKGVFIVYFISVVLTPIAIFLPESFIGRQVYDSLILFYFRDFNFFNLMFDYLPSKTYI